LLNVDRRDAERREFVVWRFREVAHEAGLSGILCARP
jgi:hypothetical protein